MSNFFKNAPAQDSEQKRFIEAVGQQQHLMVTAPLGYVSTELYALPAMLSGGLVVVICANQSAIRHHLEYFKSAGFQFPDVAILDGTQMPHEERTIKAEINKNRVRILYTVPERFISLTFLEVLVHSPIRFLIIDQAERFLPGQIGHGSYERLRAEGLEILNQRPPTVLLLPPLPASRLETIGKRLHINPFKALPIFPKWQDHRIEVRRLFTEHQKLQALIQKLSGNPGPGKVGRLDQPGNVLIQAVYPAQAEKLGATLIDYGFENVVICHSKKTSIEQAKALQLANNRLHNIVVNGGSDFRFWTPPVGSKRRLIFWSPPQSLEELYSQVFRTPTQNAGSSTEGLQLDTLILYTKEDFQLALKRVQRNPYLDVTEIKLKTKAFQYYRSWVLSRHCRLLSLQAFYLGKMNVQEMEPCGICDCCRNSHQQKGILSFLQSISERWAF